MKSMIKNISQRNTKKTDLQTLVHKAFRAMLENTRDMVFIKDANLVYVAASMPFVEMVGKKSEEEIVNRTDLELFEDKELAQRYRADDYKLLEEGMNLIDYMEPITDDNGQARYGSTSKYILTDDNGDFIGILGITRDITRDYIARRHYQQELKYLFELPADTYAVSYVDVDGWRIISQRRQFINGRTMDPFYTMEHLVSSALEQAVDSDSEMVRFYSNFTLEHLREIYESGRSTLSFKYRRRLSDGTVGWVYNEVRFLIDVENGHLCAMLFVKDIDAQKQEEQQLVEAARLDKMTRLLNRETTMEYIEEIIQENAGDHHALFIIDVDNFKKLNDTMGHQAGDEFLITLAVALKNCFRGSDVVGRVGGDEFFALMRNISGIPSAERKAQELLETINKICVGYGAIGLSASIGIALYPENGMTLEELYGDADGALYQAKRKGKKQFAFAG